MNRRPERLPIFLFRGMRILVLALILCFSASFGAHAQEASASSSMATESAEGFAWQDYQDPALKRPEDNPVANALGVLAKLGLVIGMIYGVAWLYKRGMIPKGLLQGGSSAGTGRAGLRVVDSLALKGTQSLHVVEVGDRVLVLGSNGRETLVKLTEWPLSAPPLRGFEAAIDQAREAPEVPSDFSDELESTLRQVIRPERGAL